MQWHPRPIRWLGVLLLAALAAATLGLLPPVRHRLNALGALAEALGGSVPRPFSPPVARVDVDLDGVTGHLYAPGRRAPGIVLVPGATPRGKDDPRAVRLARALSRAGRVVFVPDLMLYERRFVPEDLDRLVRASRALGEHPVSRGRVGLLGVSYGGSFALVAAADHRLDGRLSHVAVFGAYHDLVGVVQAVTTGVSLVDGTRIPWRGHPRAQRILERYAATVLPAEERPQLRAALRGRRDPATLAAGPRAMHDLLVNRDPRRTRPLAERLPVRARELFRRFSPSSVAGRIAVPVVAMHSTDDPAVPYAESLRLARAIPNARVVLVASFRHVDPVAEPGRSVRLLADLWRAWTFSTWVLGAGG